MRKRNRIVTYSRVSTLHRDQKPEVQVEFLRQYCKARDWIITHEIIDHGFSGGTDNRPGLKKLLALVRSREIDIVITVKMDRLFRSLKHLVTTLEEFEFLQVQFIAIKDNVDYTSPSGRLFVQVLGALSEFERSILRDRTIMGLEHARRKGKVLGRPKKRDDEAIQRLRSQGLSYTAIQKQLGVSRGAIYRSIKDTILKSPSKTVDDDRVISGGYIED